jgi:tRNA(Phe) wybutosine-synthesizing methylase Tyw3
MEKKLIVNVDGTEEMVDLTSEEQEIRVKDHEEGYAIWSQIKEENAKAKLLKDSALNKLIDLGLTEDEAKAFLG